MRCFAVVVVTLAIAVAAAASDPDIAILTNVRARELRFSETPRVEVKVWGDLNGHVSETVSRTDRQNLPDPVQPYVTYRDIGILLTITSTLPDIEQILDEALGTTTPPAPPPPPPTQQPRKKSKHR